MRLRGILYDKTLATNATNKSFRFIFNRIAAYFRKIIHILAKIITAMTTLKTKTPLLHVIAPMAIAVIPSYAIPSARIDIKETSIQRSIIPYVAPDSNSFYFRLDIRNYEILNGDSPWRLRIYRDSIIDVTYADSRFDFIARDSSLIMTGREMPEMRLSSITPLLVAHLPLNFNKSVTSSFCFSGTAYQNIKIEEKGSSSTTYDASGILILSDIDSLNVGRIHISKQSLIDFYPTNKDKCAYSIIHSIDSYLWFSADHAFPFLESRHETYSDINHNILDSSQISYLCPLTEQKPLKQIFKNNNGYFICPTEIYGQEATDHANISHSLYPCQITETDTEIRMSFPDYANIYPAQLTISDCFGIVLYSATVKSANTISIDISNYRSGNYILHIQYSEGMNVYKFNVK